MKKTFLLLLAATMLSSCSTRKKTNESVFMKGFFSYYNTLFNSKDALEIELRNRDASHKDNFYAPYINLLTTEQQPYGPDLLLSDGGMFGDDPTPQDNNGPPGYNPNFNPSGGFQPNTPGRKGATVLEIAEAKALKALKEYSVIKGGEEKNKKMFEAHLLLAQARLYQNKPLEALDGLNAVFSTMSKDKRLPLAHIYEGLAYSKMNDFYRAEEIFSRLKQNKIKKEYQKLLHVYYAEMLLAAGKKEEAITELDAAYAVNKNNKLRSRIAFLRGQILANLGKMGEARESFVTAYRNSNDFEFEVKSQVEIAKTFNNSTDDYEGARKYLEKISEKGTYASRKNEFYYALGLMATQAGKKEDANVFFTKALSEKTSDPQIRGLTYYELGKEFFNNSDYLAAGAYYDSALTVMNYPPSKTLLEEKSAHIKDFSANYYLIKKNDSILSLTKMSEGERTAFFQDHISKIKEKEARQEVLLKKAKRNSAFETVDFSSSVLNASNNSFQDFTSSKGGFYFANLGTVAKGEANFKQIWGNRALSDNWRTSAKSSSLEDLKYEAMGLSNAPDPRRLEPAFYTEQIPKDKDFILSLKNERDSASLDLGRMYQEYFGDRELATRTLYDLVDNEPEEKIKLQALYQIFALNYEGHPAEADRAKNIILREYPYTSYAEFVRNPQSNNFAKSTPEVERYYEEAYHLYEDSKYDESKALIEKALERYPNDALVPKFFLLRAFNTGKSLGKEIMILQLEQIALNYATTPEGKKAKEMLNYLESDLSIETVDNQGRKIPVNNVPPAPGSMYDDDEPSAAQKIPPLPPVQQDRVERLPELEVETAEEVSVPKNKK